MNKKAIALTLALLLVVSAFAGCANTPAEVSPSESASPSESTSPSPSPGQSQTPDEPVEKSLYPVSDELITLSVYWGGNGQPLPYMDADFWSAYSPGKYIESVTNVHVDWFAFEMDVYVTNLTLMLAGGDYVDIINQAEERYTGGIDALIEDEIVIDLADLIPEYAPDYNKILQDYPIFAKQTKSDSGRVASIHSVSEESVVGSGLLIRQDYLDKIGMAVPTSFDDLFNVLLAMKTELNLKHTVVMQKNLSYNNNGLSNGYDVAIFRIGSQLTFLVDDDGKVQASCMTPQFKEYFRMLHDWYEAGVLSDETLTIDNERYFEDYMTRGEIGFWGASTGHLNPDYATLSDDPDFNIQPIADISNLADGKTHLGVLGGFKRDYTGYSVTTQCEYPEAAVAWLNFNFTPEGMLLSGLGVEGESYVVNPDGSKSYTELITKNPEGIAQGIMREIYRAAGPQIVLYEVSAIAYTTDAQKNSASIWASNRTTNHMYFGALTVEETDSIGSKEGDMATLVDESIAQLVFGGMNFEADYDRFQADMISLGIEEVTALKQAAYNRYLNRA